MNPNEFDDMLAKVNQLSVSGRQGRNKTSVLKKSRTLNRLSIKTNNRNTQTIKISLELTIRKLHLEKAEDNTDFSILWVRGEKKIDTRTRTYQYGVVTFNERFMMKTNIEYNTSTDEYSSKPVSLSTAKLTQNFDLVLTSSDNGKGRHANDC